MAPHNEGTELGWVEQFKAAFCKYIGEPCVYMADWYVENFLKTINLVLFGAMHWFLYQIFLSTSSDELFRNLLNLLFLVVCKFVLLSIKYPVLGLYLFFGEEFGASFESLKEGLDEFLSSESASDGDDGDKQMAQGASESKKPDNGDGDDDMGASPQDPMVMATPKKDKPGNKRKRASPFKEAVRGMLFGKSKSDSG